MENEEITNETRAPNDFLNTKYNYSNVTGDRNFLLRYRGQNGKNPRV